MVKGSECCLVYLEYPDPIRTTLKTNNHVKRYLQELGRQIIPMRFFNKAKSVERIIYGLIAYVLNRPQDVPNYQSTQLDLLNGDVLSLKEEVDRLRLGVYIIISDTSKHLCVTQSASH